MTAQSQRTQKSSAQQGQSPEVGSDIVVGSIPQGSQDALRTMLQSLIQETVEVEFTRFLGAGVHERSDHRTGWRNGSRPRSLFTRVGKLELRIPRDRDGEFQPALFGRYQRSEQAFILALAEMYLQGVSTRKVSAVVEQLCGMTISASTVSRCTKRLHETTGRCVESLAQEAS
jgi:putative transposase